jgi:L-fuculose-phosphate aldolase
MGNIEIKKDIAKFMKRLCDKNLTTTFGGNISIRSEDGTVYMTPSVVDKSELSPEDICVLDMEGNRLEGTYKPTMEYMMHLSIYKARNDVNAICHSHPFYCVLYASTDEEIRNDLTLESEMHIKKINRVGYFPPGTQELAESAAKAAADADFLLLNRHGAITMADSMLNAFYRMEVLEMTARLNYCRLNLLR